MLAAFEPYLAQRWARGCRNRSRLFREIRAQGYQHSARIVFTFLQRLDRDTPADATPLTRVTPQVPSARHVALLLVQRPEALADAERDYLTRLGDHEPTLAMAHELAQVSRLWCANAPARSTSRPGSPERP